MENIPCRLALQNKLKPKLLLSGGSAYFYCKKVSKKMNYFFCGAFIFQCFYPVSVFSMTEKFIEIQICHTLDVEKDGVPAAISGSVLFSII